MVHTCWHPPAAIWAHTAGWEPCWPGALCWTCMSPMAFELPGRHACSIIGMQFSMQFGTGYIHVSL